MNSVKPNSYAWNIKCLHYQAANIYGLEQSVGHNYQFIYISNFLTSYKWNESYMKTH